MRSIKALLFLLSLTAFCGSTPQVAQAGELFDIRNNFDRFYDYRSRSLSYTRRSFAQFSTAASRITNPFGNRGRGGVTNVFEERRFAYMRAAYEYQLELYEYQRRLAEQTIREQQRKHARVRTEQIRNARAQAVQLRRASASTRLPARARLTDDLFASKKSSNSAPAKGQEAQKPGFWNKLKSAFFG
mgnify:CR=1 FL=1